MDKLIGNDIRELATYIAEKLPADFGMEDVEQLTSFLWSMLRQYPEDRKTTTELLNDPFLL